MTGVVNYCVSSLYYLCSKIFVTDQIIFKLKCVGVVD